MVYNAMAYVWHHLFLRRQPLMVRKQSILRLVGYGDDIEELFGSSLGEICLCLEQPYELPGPCLLATLQSACPRHLCQALA